MVRTSSLIKVGEARTSRATKKKISMFVFFCLSVKLLNDKVYANDFAMKALD